MGVNKSLQLIQITTLKVKFLIPDKRKVIVVDPNLSVNLQVPFVNCNNHNTTSDGATWEKLEEVHSI